VSRKPFRIDQPAPHNVNEAQATKALNPADARDHADSAGVTLHEAGAEVMVPDGEHGPLDEAPEDDGGRPVYAPAIPWPAAKNGPKPYKI
jgi:hypothetical protein